MKIATRQENKLTPRWEIKPTLYENGKSNNVALRRQNYKKKKTHKRKS
jgi:hypothetical protein